MRNGNLVSEKRKYWCMDFPNWTIYLPTYDIYIYRNYTTELVAFQARLGETFDDTKLRQAFISPEYVELEQKQRQELLQVKNCNLNC